MIAVILVPLFGFLLLLGWTLLAPLHLLIDSGTSTYKLWQAATLTVIYQPNHTPSLSIRWLGIGVKPPEALHGSWKAWRFLRESVRSLEFKKVVAEIDTGDVILNAYLFPVLQCLSRDTVRLSIDFLGRNLLHIEADAKVNRLLWIYFRIINKKQMYGHEF